MTFKDFSIITIARNKSYKNVNFIFEHNGKSILQQFSIFDPTGEAEHIIRNVVIEILQHASLEGLILIASILNKTIDIKLNTEKDEEQNDTEQLQ